MGLPELYTNTSAPGTVTALTTLAAEAKIGDAEITVTAAAPAALQGTGQFRIVIGTEILIVTGGASTTKWTVTRGAEGTAAAAHPNASSIYHFLTEGALKTLLESLTGAILLDEPFTEDRSATFVFDQATAKGGLTVEGGVLKTTDALDHSFHIALEVGDAIHIVKVKLKNQEPTTYLMLNYIDDSNWLMVQWNNGSLRILQCVATVVTELASVVKALPTDPCWIVARKSGNRIVAELWRVDPRLFARGAGNAEEQVAACTAKLAAGAPTEKFGEGKKGKVGLRLTGGANPGPTESTLDDWIIMGPARYAF